MDHFEARFLALHVALARGWERQLDLGRDGLFYGGASALIARAGVSAAAWRARPQPGVRGQLQRGP